MIGRAIDLTGQRFGKLIVVRRTGSRNKKALWLCRCDCGGYKEVVSTQLRNGGCQSCGCLGKQRTSEAKTTHGYTRAGKRTPTYNAWASMKQRCDNSNDRNYKNYGARGISYDPHWRDFGNFLADMGECPPSMTLERPDNDAGYGKANCAWVSRTEQARNRRMNRWIEYRGKTQTLAEWADELGIGYDALHGRLRRGWSIKRAFTTPIGPAPENRQFPYEVEYQGETLALTEWAEQLGISYKTLHYRLTHGWSVERAFTTPTNGHFVMVEYEGKTQSIAEWAEEFGMPYHTLYQRLKRFGWPVEKAFTTPVAND